MADLMIVATIALVLLLVSGLPIFLVFLSVNAAIVLFQIGPSGYGMFVNSMLNTATTQALATIPLFILMGEVIFRAGRLSACSEVSSWLSVYSGQAKRGHDAARGCSQRVVWGEHGGRGHARANSAANPFKSRLPKTNQRRDHTGGGKPHPSFRRPCWSLSLAH